MARQKAKKPQNMPDRKAGIYLRVSTEEQAEEGQGIDSQLRKCQGMAAMRDWAVAGVYADRGISGTRPASERPELSRLLADLEAGQISVVIVAALDRLGRKTTIVLDLVERITGAGAEFASTKEALDTSTATGRFVLTMFAALAQLDRDNIVERTTDGRNERGRKDGERGGRMPYGYLRTPDGPVIDRSKTTVIRQIFRLRGKRPRPTLRQIAEQLTVPGPRGGRWHASSVAEVLRHEAAYRGGMRGESAVCWPAILTNKPVDA